MNRDGLLTAVARRVAEDPDWQAAEDAAGGALAAGGAVDPKFGSVYNLSEPMGQFYWSGTAHSNIGALMWCDHNRRCIGMRYLK